MLRSFWIYKYYYFFIFPYVFLQYIASFMDCFAQYAGHSVVIWRSAVKLNLPKWALCKSYANICVWRNYWRSHLLPLSSSASYFPKLWPNNSHECACRVSPGNRIRADIFLAACAFGHMKNGHLFVWVKGKCVPVCSPPCVTSLIPLVNWDEHQLRVWVRSTNTTNRLTFCTGISNSTSLMVFCLQPSLQ